MQTLRDIQRTLKKEANKEVALKQKRFFKTKKGEYAYGDIFLGVKMPIIRNIAKKSIFLNLSEIEKIMRSKYHEERLLALVILVYKYSEEEKKRNEDNQEEIYRFYVKNLKYINNWDLVDVSCPHIIGKHLMSRDRGILYLWAKSDDLWIKRIAMVTNWWFLRKGDLKEVFKLSETLLRDEHDLIHKAVGWMLREAGKKDLNKLEIFLAKHYSKMPRTMLRYAIEKFPKEKRHSYLKGSI